MTARRHQNVRPELRPTGTLGHASGRAAASRAATPLPSLPPDESAVLSRLASWRSKAQSSPLSPGDTTPSGARARTDHDNRLPHADGAWVAGSYWRQELIAICGETREPRRGTGAR